MMENAENWFIGVDYHPLNSDLSLVDSIAIKDLFNRFILHFTINFDAAIQIQAHVHDLKEINQTKEEFIQRLSQSFIENWHAHIEKKTERYEKLVTKIQILLD